ncbi:MAG: hypothetical protein F4074_01020, partial [Synechococcus sp. SB0672_bin_10]|nr:hypothetical protein [Synechococcus sp. SB0672_bin_10]
PSSSASEGTDFSLRQANGKKLTQGSLDPNCRFISIAPNKTQSEDYKIRVKGDTNYEGDDETVVLKLKRLLGFLGTPDAVKISPTANTITHTIQEDDAIWASLELVGAASAPEGNSGTKNYSFRVNLTEALTTISFFHLCVDPSSSASEGTDFSLINSSGKKLKLGELGAPSNCVVVLVAPNKTSQDYQIRVKGDEVYEGGDETVVLKLKRGSADNVKISSTANTITHTIKEEADDPNVQASLELVGAASAPEGNSGTTDHTFRVNLSRARSTQTNFTLCIDPSSSASEGTDFSLRQANGKKLTLSDSNCTFVFVDLNKIQSEAYKIRVKGDTNYEGDETVVLKFGRRNNTPNYVTFSPTANTITHTIENDDIQASLELVGAASAPEGDSGTTDYTFRVNLSKAHSVVTQFTPLTVCVDPSSSASAGTDFSLRREDGSLIKLAKSSVCRDVLVKHNKTQSENYKIRVKGDTNYEGDETVVLKFGRRNNTPNYVTFSPTANTITHTIENDDHGVQVDATSVVVRENEGTTSYAIRLLSNPGGTVTVTPTSDDANKATVSGAVSFNNNNWETLQEVTVTGTGNADDTVTITHVITTATDNYPISMTVEPVEVTVTAADSQPQVSLSVSNAGMAEEGGSNLIITVTISAVNTSGLPLSVPLQVKSADTTGQSDDYQLGATTISIPHGATTGTTTFTAVDDSTDEPPETVVVELGALPANLRPGADNEVAITIADNDATTVTLTTPDASTTEGYASDPAKVVDPAEVVLTLNRGLVAGEKLTIPLALDGPGTSIMLMHESRTGVSVHYSSPMKVTFTGPSAKSMKVTLWASSDHNAANEIITASIPSSSSSGNPRITATGLGGGAMGVRKGSGKIVLVDSSISPGVLVSPTSLSVRENDGTATYDIRLLSNPGGTVIIAPYLAFSGPTSGRVTVSGPLTFDATNWYTEQSVTITGKTEGSGVTITHVITTATDNYPISMTVEPVEVTVTAADSQPQVSLSVSNAGMAEEGGSNLIITVTISAVNTSGLPLSVPLQVKSADTTGQSDDYQLGATTISIPHGATTGTTTFTAVDDSTDEPPETVVVELGALPANLRPGADNEVAITIADNDPTPLTVSLAAEKSAITEANGRTKFTIVLSRVLAAGETATVPYTVTGGKWNDHWNITAPDTLIGPGVERTGGGAKAAVKFSEGGQTATLTLIGRPDSDRVDRPITIAFGEGKRVPRTNVEGGIMPVGGPLEVTIVDSAMGLTVSLAAAESAITEANGRTKFTIALSRVLEAGERATVPFTVTGGEVNDHWNITAPDTLIGPGVERTGGGAKAAVKFSEGGQTATLTLIGRPDSDRVDRPITIAFGEGKRVPRTNVEGGIMPVGGPLEVIIVDSDEAALWVDNAMAKEDQGLMRFNVRLSAPLQETVSVYYQTQESHPVSARQGQDYIARNGRLDFQPGQTRRQVRIKIHDDAHDEGAETFQLVLSSPRGARIADAVGVGTIVNTDVMPAAWLSRLGRTVSQKVVDALQDRFAAPPSSPGLTLTVAGEDLTGMVPLAENQQVLSKALGFETVTGQQLVEGSSFSFSPTADAPAQFTLWGRGALASFSGAEDSVSLEGDVTTALVGADWSTARWRAGAALSHSWGSGSYGRGGDNSGDGDVSATLAGLFPYGRYGLTPRLGIWAVAGYGWGELSLEPDGAGAEYKPGVNLGMAAVGMDGLLLDGGAAGLSLTTTADVLTLKTTSEEVDGLASSESAISRLRLGLEATRPFPLANGASLLPSLEVGIRQDGGDAETGFGMEIGAGMGWSDPERGINAEMKGRTLLTHVEEEFQEQGLALSFAWDPTPSNRGPSFSLNHAVGAVVEGGMEALLRPTVMEPLDDTPRSPWQQQLETRFAYGFPVFGDRLTLTPALALALSSSSRTYGLLWSVAPHAQQAQGEPWEVALEGERQEHAASASPTDHSLKLRFSLLF